MNLKALAFVFGIVLLTVGIIGFIPALAPHEMLFGLFHVNGFHNIVHILSGIAGLYASSRGFLTSRLYFQIFGAIYGVVAILGFIVGEGYIFGILSNNMPNSWLHVAIAATSLFLGFAIRSDAPDSRSRTTRTDRVDRTARGGRRKPRFT